MPDITQDYIDLKAVNTSKVLKPEPGNKRLFLDVSDNNLKLKDSTDSVAALGSATNGTLTNPTLVSPSVSGSLTVNATVPASLNTNYSYQFWGKSGEIMGHNSANLLDLTANVHYDNISGDIYKENGIGTKLRLNDGSLTLYNSPSGSTGAPMTLTQRFQITPSGTAIAQKFQLSALNTAPSSATDTGTTGEIRIVNGFIYVCVNTNTWQRSALSTW